MGNFEITDNFYLDGKPFQIISGAIHYFRIVPEYWQDRLEKLKAMGCNTVETYIPWNMHEPKKGEFHFEGMLDIERFVKTAQELGLYVILRPSPYICAEWEFGGLPAWLLAEDGMKLRVSYPPFLKHVQEPCVRKVPLPTATCATNALRRTGSLMRYGKMALCPVRTPTAGYRTPFPYPILRRTSGSSRITGVTA